MDAFFVVLALLVLAFPIIAIVALVKSVGLGEQLRRVETRLAALERTRVAPAPDVSERQAPMETPAPPISEPMAAPLSPAAAAARAPPPQPPPPRAGNTAPPPPAPPRVPPPPPAPAAAAPGMSFEE